MTTSTLSLTSEIASLRASTMALRHAYDRAWVDMNYNEIFLEVEGLYECEDCGFIICQCEWIYAPFESSEAALELADAGRGDLALATYNIAFELEVRCCPYCGGVVGAGMEHRCSEMPF